MGKRLTGGAPENDWRFSERVEIEAAIDRSEEASVGVEVIAKSFSFKQPRGNVLRSVKPLQMGAAE